MSNTNKNTRSGMRILRQIILLAFAGTSLAACSSTMPGLSSGTPSLAPSAANNINAPAQTLTKQPEQPAKTVSMTMAPIVGPPAGVTKKLNAKIVSELKRRNINVVKKKAGYKMRGYVVSSSEGNSAKLAYIWDLNNKAGRRQTRITGEKSVYNDKGADPWKGVNDKVISDIAKDTANQLAGWMVRKDGGSVKTASASRKLKARAKRVPTASRPPATTASTSKAKRVVMAMVMPVTGAPGDGKSSLTKAIKKSLYGKGVRLTSSRTDSVYQVRGVVQVGKTAKGKQPIRIDWRVYDPKGKRLGTVTQKNEIPKGSLNGPWGAIADAAAGAAADGITKLLPKSSRRL